MHPVAAALIAFARLNLDIDGRLARHISQCTTCAELVEGEKRWPMSADEGRVLESLAQRKDALRAAAAVWAKAR